MHIAILLGVVRQGNARLPQLAENLRGIEGVLARIGARDKHTRSCVGDAIQWGSPPFPKVARILVQGGWQYSVDYEAPRELVTLLGQLSFSECTPALSIVGNPIRRLRNPRLDQIAKMRALVKELVPCDIELLLGGERPLVFRLVVGRHEIGNDPEDPLGHLILGFAVFLVRLRGRLGSRRWSGVLRGCLEFGFRAVWLFVTIEGHPRQGQRAQGCSEKQMYSASGHLPPCP